jgi:hypothetical protein
VIIYTTENIRVIRQLADVSAHRRIVDKTFSIYGQKNPNLSERSYNLSDRWRICANLWKSVDPPAGGSWTKNVCL